MSFLTQQQKIETEKKADEGAKKEDSPVPAPAPVVYKLDLHCEGCIKKIKRSARHFAGNSIVLFSIFRVENLIFKIENIH